VLFFVVVARVAVLALAFVDLVVADFVLVAVAGLGAEVFLAMLLTIARRGIRNILPACKNN